MGEEEFLSPEESTAYWQHRRDRAVLALPVLTVTWVLLAAVTVYWIVVLRPGGDYSTWAFWFWGAIVLGLAWTGWNIAHRWSWPEAQRRWWGRGG